MRLIQGIFVAAATILTAASAQAATAWSTWGSACTPDPLVTDRYATSGQIVAHRASNVDLIRLVCGINPFQIESTSWRLAVTYRDATGTVNSANVEARLVRGSRLTGSQVNIASFDSDSSEATTVTKGFTTFTHTFNFETFSYFVVVQLDRTLTSEVVQFLAVAIETPPT
jgi:hypothetical protein